MIAVFASVKGSPGVTTLTCLIAGSWAEGRRAVVAECDPSGGDLATRFGLTVRTGWASLSAASRRSEPQGGLDPHLQQLPGGLAVLVAPGVGDQATSGTPAHMQALATLREWAKDGDLLVDLGRLQTDLGDPGWLRVADVVCVVSKADASSILHVKLRSDAVRSAAGEQVCLVLVGQGPYSRGEVERFVGIPIVGEFPSDPAAAAVATAGQGPRRRLIRSGLAVECRRVAGVLSGGGKHQAAAISTRPTGIEESQRTGDDPQWATRRSSVNATAGPDESNGTDPGTVPTLPGTGTGIESRADLGAGPYAVPTGPSRPAAHRVVPSLERR